MGSNPTIPTVTGAPSSPLGAGEVPGLYNPYARITPVVLAEDRSDRVDATASTKSSACMILSNHNFDASESHFLDLGPKTAEPLSSPIPSSSRGGIFPFMV